MVVGTALAPPLPVRVSAQAAVDRRHRSGRVRPRARPAPAARFRAPHRPADRLAAPSRPAGAAAGTRAARPAAGRPAAGSPPPPRRPPAQRPAASSRLPRTTGRMPTSGRRPAEWPASPREHRRRRGPPAPLRQLVGGKVNNSCRSHAASGGKPLGTCVTKTPTCCRSGTRGTHLHPHERRDVLSGHRAGGSTAAPSRATEGAPPPPCGAPHQAAPRTHRRNQHQPGLPPSRRDTRTAVLAQRSDFACSVA
jgi:hypothetical protein